MFEDEELPPGIEELFEEYWPSLLDEGLAEGNVELVENDISLSYFDQKLSVGNEEVFEVEDVRISSSPDVVWARSEEIARGRSPMTRSINHL